MKKKILKTLLATAAVATLSIAGAQAGTLDSVAGPVKFLYDGFDAAQTTYSTTTNGVLCNSVTACNTASGAADAPGASQPNDTYGVAKVSSIVENIPFGNALWNNGDNNESLVAYFYGFQDSRVDVVSPTQTNIFSTGGHVDIYRVADNFFTTTLDVTDQTSIETSLASLPSKYLTLDFIPGCDLAITSATLCGTFNLGTLFGGSSGYAMATGGDAMSKYPNNFQFEQSIEPCNVNVTCPAPSSFNIVVRSSSATTIALPEPGALGLLGFGLVGLGLMGRRRKAAREEAQKDALT